MAIRSNKILFTFDPATPRITAHDIHERLHAEIRIQEQEVQMIQIGGVKRQVRVKLTDNDYMLPIINSRGGKGEYKHHTEEISPVEIAVAGMGYKKIRVANLSPEVLDDTLRATLAQSGQVLNIQNEMWARTYRYTVANGVRQVNMLLTKHVASHLVIARQRVLISYDGQHTTFYGCGGTGHLYPTCPRRQRTDPLPSPTTPVTYATIAATMPQSSGHQLGDNIHGGRSHLLEHVVESNDQNMDPPHGPERCNSPMDSTQDAELGGPRPPTSLHRNTRWSFRSHVVRRHRPLRGNERHMPAKARD
jgi:hypothetical protein